MPLELQWKIEGETQLARRLNGIGNRVKDFRSEFKKSTNFLKDFFGGEVFDTKGRAIGEPWKPRKVPKPWPLLQKTGRMKRGFRAKASKMSGEVYNAVDYFKYHQSRQPRYKLPRRIMMKLTNQLKDRIVKFFHEGLWNKVHRNI